MKKNANITQFGHHSYRVNNYHHSQKKLWTMGQSGASDVLLADNIIEPLIKVDSPKEPKDEDPDLIDKKTLKRDEEVLWKIDWNETIPNPDVRVEYEPVAEP
ncbi:hypothetical protein YC2023_064833 [Brassica napus]